MSQHTFKSTWRRPVFKRVPTEDGRGVTSKPAGHERADITVFVDVDALVSRMAEDAMRNKRKFAIEAGGAIKVVASNVRRES